MRFTVLSFNFFDGFEIFQNKKLERKFGGKSEIQVEQKNGFNVYIKNIMSAADWNPVHLIYF